VGQFYIAGDNPQLSTVLKVAKALKLQLHVKPTVHESATQALPHLHDADNRS